MDYTEGLADVKGYEDQSIKTLSAITSSGRCYILVCRGYNHAPNIGTVSSTVMLETEIKLSALNTRKGLPSGTPLGIPSFVSRAYRWTFQS